MKELRYLVRLAHPGRYQPSDHPDLLRRARAAALPLGVSVMNLRVASRAVEFDCFPPPGSDVARLHEAWNEIGPLETWRRLDADPEPIEEGVAVAEARDLFNEERYWEVHEALEPVWLKKEGAEKKLVQGLILAAAALVHWQRNEAAVIPSLLKEAIERLQGQPEFYFTWPVAAFRERLLAMQRSGQISPFTV